MCGGDLPHADAKVPLDAAANDRIEHAGHRRSGVDSGLTAAGHLPDMVCVPEIVAHEPFDGEHTFAATVAHDGGHPQLLGAVEHVLARAGVEMHFVPQP